MGLLTLKEGAEDVSALTKRTTDLADIWNASPATKHGFKLHVGEEEVVEACKIGTRVLKAHFSDPPSAFKRTAAVLVIGRLFPFIGPKPEPATLHDYHKWMARIMCLLMPSILASIKVRLMPCHHPRKESYTRIPPFTAWPSPHVKAEFLEWLASLDSFPWLHTPRPDGIQVKPEDIQALSDQRMARMIMATSLIIENAYYCMECMPATRDKTHVRYQCYTCIEKIATDLDLTFQNWIVE